MGDKATLVFGAARQAHKVSQVEPPEDDPMSSTNLQGTSPPQAVSPLRPPRPSRAMPAHAPPTHAPPTHAPPSKPIPNIPCPPPPPTPSFLNNSTNSINGSSTSLSLSLSSSSSLQAPASQSYLIVEEPPVGSIPDPSPSSPVLRPYWLMRMWLRTMIGGGYLTPRIYVPPSLWTIDGSKFAALQTKISTCEAILEGLMKLKGLDLTKTDIITKGLDIYCVHLDALQNTLHMHFSFIAEIKMLDKVKEETGWGKIKKFGGVLAKSAVRLAPLQRDEDAEYIQLLQAIFEESQFLTDWLSIFGGGEESIGGTLKRKQAFPAIIGKIHRISEFFMDVLCAFVVRDLNILIERYMKKNLLCFLKLKQK